MSDSASMRYLDSIERHYYFELERRDRIHASIRVLITLILAILGAAWLLITSPTPAVTPDDTNWLYWISVALCVAAACVAVVGLVIAAPIATEDLYEIILHEDLTTDAQTIIGFGRDTDEYPDGDEAVRMDALSTYLTRNFEKAALANAALNEQFIGYRRKSTRWLYAAASLTVVGAASRLMGNLL